MISGGITGGVKGLANIDVDLRKAKEPVGAIIRTDVRAQMEQSYGKRKWKALANSTLKKPRRSPRPFDTKSKEMWESFTQRGHPLHHFVAKRNYIEVGSDMDDIPVYQMEGTRTISKRSIEATPAMATEVVEAVADSIMDMI